ncbi:thyroglobulin-like, partial [Scleropages formosus]
YQLESETLSACELLRVDGASGQQEHVAQCAEDGRFRHVQCSRGGDECWCVNAVGVEIPGSRQKGSAVHCLTPCQLRRQQVLLSGEDAAQVPLCSDSGGYRPIQCDRTLGQCWCVDQDGEEIYGTRQNGEFSRCECGTKTVQPSTFLGPGSCEIQERRLLHGAGQNSPPQCSADGGFLPVQCKFINTTDMREVDLLLTFNRSPELFQTFSGFRRLFPEISSYCFCADSVELLLDEVYDTAFSGTQSGLSFSQSNIYRVLQRRFLALQLAISGKFRCPSRCESERSSSLKAGNVFVPTCDADGTYKPVQCQPGGQCWCVDSSGSEVLGTRRRGGPPNCRAAGRDCPSERRQALSRIFLGPSDDLSPLDMFSGKQADRERDPIPLSLCSPEVQELLAKSGLLRSVPQTEQFDMGDVLSEVIQGMFPTGALALKALSVTTNPKRLQENLFGGKFLKNAGNFNFTGAVGLRGTFSFRQAFDQVGLMEIGSDLTQLAKVFSPGMDSRPENVNLDQEIQDSFGRPINLKNNQKLIKLLGTTLENEQFFTTLRDIIILSKAEDSTELGILFRAAFQSSRQGACKRDPEVLYVPRCTDSGQYQEVQCQGPVCWCVDPQGLEVAETRLVGQRPRCPSQCEKERKAAMMLKASLSAGSELFIPKSYGLPGGSGTAVLERDPSAVSRVSEVYLPRCNMDGSWHDIQCDGPPEQAFQFYQEWVSLNNGGRPLPVPELVGTIREYATRPAAMASFQEFVKELFDSGHQRVFPALSQYTDFSDIPQEILEGDPEIVGGPSVLLNPLSLWQLLHSNATTYPGKLSDFSTPLAHFNLRQCWCINKANDMISDTKAAANQIPYCPGPCSLVSRQVDQFLREAEEVISISNSSHFPLGYGFLLAKGLGLTREELQSDVSPGSFLAERLLSPANSALRLAVHSNCPVPPQRCSSTGVVIGLQLENRGKVSCWGTSRTAPNATPAVIGSPLSATTAQNGEFSVMQPEDPDGLAWCVSPVTGKAIRPASPGKSGALQCPGWCEMLRAQVVTREAGVGYEPQCQADGRLFSPMQCDQAECWCVSQGEPQCPYLLDDTLLSHGVVFCDDLPEGELRRQRCQLWCYQGYHNALPISEFLCDVPTKTWVSDVPLPHACQRPGGLQAVKSSILLQLSLSQGQEPCSSQSPALRHSLLQDLRAQGLCSLQSVYSGGINTVSICDESSVLLDCVSDDKLEVLITRRAQLSDLPVEALPDLHDIDAAFSRGRLTEGLVDLIRSGSYPSIFSSDSAVVLAPVLNFTCSRGYRRIPGVTGCVACPSGTFLNGEVCTLCPLGSYQDQEGKDFCIECPAGTSTAALGTYRDTHLSDRVGVGGPATGVTECQRSALKCTSSGDFQAAQQDTQTGKWVCVSRGGEQLLWTSSMDVLTEQQCRGHEFTMKAKKTFEKQAFRKVISGTYRTVVFAAEGATLTDVHRFCLDACSNDSCCDGFILNQNIFNGGWLSVPYVFFFLRLLTLILSWGFCVCWDEVLYVVDCATDWFFGCHVFMFSGTIMCGLLSYPDAFMCSDTDWDFMGPQGARQACGAGVQYNKLRKQLFFSFGGHNFTISKLESPTDAALPATSKNKTDYQASIILFQRIYFWNDSDLATRQKSSAACLGVTPQGTSAALISEEVKEDFSAADSAAILVDSNRDVPSLKYLIFKHMYSAEQAERWCLKQCEEEEFCHLADVRDESRLYFTCVLYPDSRVCGAYDKPLRQACSLVLPLTPQSAYTRTVTLAGNVKNFYRRVPFKKMVSYSVRSRVSVTSKPITEGFFECERRCDEDPCCRGIGYVRDTQSPGSDVLCLTLNSLGIQTCGEEDRTGWRAMDCSPSKVESRVFPFGWYEKPVNQWTRSPHLCPAFRLTGPLQSVNMSDWEPLGSTSVLTDSSISTFDVIHISKDIAQDLDRSFPSACTLNESCSLVAVDRKESAVRCTLYPDTRACTPATGGLTCRLLVKEPARYLYLRKDAKRELKSVLIPGHGRLLGDSQVATVGQEWKRVVRFLGVPFARPPVGPLRFSAPQSADWKDTWNATFPRPSCVQPGDVESALVSEDCLYLNIFIPNSIKGNSSVLVFFHNPLRGPSGDGPMFLDGSYLAAVGDVIVVTASFRVAAFGFLSAGSSGNSGLQDQAAALTWVQKNIAYFGGDPAKVTLGAERNGADIASLHLVSAGTGRLFQRALLMGPDSMREMYAAMLFLTPKLTAESLLSGLPGLFWSINSDLRVSADSAIAALFHRRFARPGIPHGGPGPGVRLPSAYGSGTVQKRPSIPRAAGLFVLIESRAALTGPRAVCENLLCNFRQMLSCLRRVSAPALNAAQTKLLSVSGPLQAWAPVLDGISVKENPSSALQKGRLHHVDLMLGSSAEDGLISRAKNIKKFEELQGRVDGKTAFYEALSNSLGGDGANELVKDAATWFYAMQHDPSPAGYNVFSRALENATRDLFIICPAVKMASFWAAQTRSNVFMYHLPEKTAQTSADLSMPLDLQFVFGVPHHLQTKDVFTAAERRLSLRVMNYVANFIKSGNPNNPQPSSWVSFSEMLPPWPRFLPHPSGDNYKELGIPLNNRKGLRRVECSFWHDYIPGLALSS